MAKIKMNMESEFSDDLSDVFHRASEYVAEKASELQQSDLLYFYAHYKQALEGSCNVCAPSIFNFRGKSKWEAWHSLQDTSKEEAMRRYIEKLTVIASDWDTKEILESSKKSFGPVISTLLNTDPEILDEFKTPFDWVKEGNVEKLQWFLNDNKSVISCQDEQGLTLLHWASDRGYVEIVSVLLSHGINIDCQDEDGQTALHYACSCGHEDLVLLLLKNGASPDVPDSEGQLPSDVALTPTIQQLIQNR